MAIDAKPWSSLYTKYGILDLSSIKNHYIHPLLCHSANNGLKPSAYNRPTRWSVTVCGWVVLQTSSPRCTSNTTTGPTASSEYSDGSSSPLQTRDEEAVCILLPVQRTPTTPQCAVVLQGVHRLTLTVPDGERGWLRLLLAVVPAPPVNWIFIYHPHSLLLCHPYCVVTSFNVCVLVLHVIRVSSISVSTLSCLGSFRAATIFRHLQRLCSMPRSVSTSASG